MARRRRSRRGPGSPGMIGGLRKNIKKGLGIVAIVTGASLAFAPVLSTVQATTAGGTNLTQQSIGALPTQIAYTYGVNPNGTTDFGKLFTAIAFPVIGGYIAIKGLKAIARAV